MNLKPLVNDKALWDSFISELDQRLEETYRAFRNTDSTDELLRLQGSARILEKMKKLRDKVNAES